MRRIRSRAVPALALSVVLMLGAGAAPSMSSAATPDHTELIARLGFGAPANWTCPIVPRMTADADLTHAVTVPDTLWSGVPTYVDWSTGKNASVCGTWTDGLWLDGQAIDTATNSDCAWSADLFPNINRGPIVVRGGVHHLRGVVDINHEVTYPIEDYNSPYWVLYTWSPEPLPAGVVTTSATPPPADPSNIGYQLDRTSPYAFVVSSVADQPADDMILRLYVDTWHGSTSGFTVGVTHAAQGPGAVNFVSGSGGGTPATVYPAVSAWTAGASGGYSLSWADAAGRRDSSASGRWPGALGPQRVATIYEVYLTAGVPLRAALVRTSGNDDLALAVGLPGAGSYWSSANPAGSSVPVSGTDSDSLLYTPASTGWYPVVVYRTTSTDRAHAAGYVLQFGTSTTDATGPAAGAFFLTAPRPNPAASPVHIDFGLESAGHSRLAIYDAQGRWVRTIADGSLPAGAQGAMWDLRDAQGAPVRAGLYWARLEVPGEQRTVRMVVTR